MKLKLGFIFIAFFMFPAIAGSQSTTLGGHIACFEESDMDDIIQFVAAQDLDSGQAYLDRKKCFIIKSGLPVTILKSPGMFGGKVQCAHKGYKFWTVREAINYK